jgi:uncharacterized protein YggE
VSLLATTAYAKGSITVRGIGKATYTPRTAQFQLRASTTKVDNANASSLNATTVRQLKSNLKRLGVKDSQIRLGYASSRPNYVPRNEGNNSRQIRDWTTTQSVTVKLPFKSANNLVGKVFSSATQFNNVTVAGPNSVFSEKAHSGAQVRARAKAVSNARKEANRQLSALGTGARLGNVLKIAPVDQGYGYAPRGGMMLEAAGAGRAAPQVNPEFSGAHKQTVTESVNTTFGIIHGGVM